MKILSFVNELQRFLQGESYSSSVPDLNDLIRGFRRGCVYSIGCDSSNGGFLFMRQFLIHFFLTKEKGKTIFVEYRSQFSFPALFDKVQRELSKQSDLPPEAIQEKKRVIGDERLSILTSISFQELFAFTHKAEEYDLDLLVFYYAFGNLAEQKTLIDKHRTKYVFQFLWQLSTVARTKNIPILIVNTLDLTEDGSDYYLYGKKLIDDFVCNHIEIIHLHSDKYTFRVYQKDLLLGIIDEKIIFD